MLSSISWQEFIILIVTLVGVYYLIATLILYRKEIVGLMKNRGTTFFKETRQDSPSNGSRTLMGTVNEENYNSSSSHSGSENAEDIVYAPSDELPDEVGSTDFEQRQLILSEQLSELIEGIKATCADITLKETEKKESVRLFQQLLSRYPRLKDSIYRESITDYVHSMTQPPFPVNLSLQEIDQMWDAAL